MAASKGWIIFGNINEERVRAFIVADATEDASLASLKKLHPEAIVISQVALPDHLMDFLKLKEGAIVEWVPADGLSMASPFVAP